ncbi:MAG TPA: DedA family protein [Candidatus Paceibacterota bacterium]|nr:DedA family protein [Candidatus Paceibacterota bacterium]
MFEAIVTAVSSFILGVISYSGYWGIFILMVVESANIPAPSEIIMTFSGFLASSGELNFWAVVSVATFANFIGSILSYWLARYYGREGINFLIKILILDDDDVVLAEKWFNRFGLTSSFIGRLLPIVRTFISLPAGLFKVNLWKFSILTLLGSFIWCLALTSAGYLAGENWETVEPYFRAFDGVIVVVAVVIISWLVYRRLHKVLK